jgi:hypothetical protein
VQRFRERATAETRHCASLFDERAAHWPVSFAAATAIYTSIISCFGTGTRDCSMPSSSTTT